MKYTRKLALFLLLLSYILPWGSVTAMNQQSTNVGVELDNISWLYSLATISEADNDVSLPHRDVFVNSLSTVDDVALLNTQTEPFLGDNGFYYVHGSPCKTRGQVDVPTYEKYDDYTEAEKLQEIAKMQDDYSTIVIVGDPTSAYNCHSYAWCEGTRRENHWIDKVDLFVNDIHTLKPIDEDDAQVGDIVIYFDGPDHISHSAVIQSITSSNIFCISKWGASVLCMHALENVPDTYKLDTGECARLIVRRSEHTGSCESSGVGQHTIACTICESNIQENCNYSYTYIGDDMHNANCIDCDNAISGAFCSFNITSNGNGTHTRDCVECGNTRTNNCNSITEYAGSNQHFIGCSYCDAGTYSDCVGTYAYCDDVTSTDQHEYVCGVCGHQMSSSAQACTFAYRYYGVVNGSNAHIYDCSACGHIKSGPTQCTYIGTKPCLQCGSVKDQASVGSVEEELADG